MTNMEEFMQIINMYNQVDTSDKPLPNIIKRLTLWLDSDFGTLTDYKRNKSDIQRIVEVKKFHFYRTDFRKIIYDLEKSNKSIINNECYIGTFYEMKDRHYSEDDQERCYIQFGTIEGKLLLHDTKLKYDLKLVKEIKSNEQNKVKQNIYNELIRNRGSYRRD